MTGRLIFALATLVAVGGSWGQSSGGDFVLTRSVIAGGGGDSAGGGFSLRGTLGQAESGTSTGGEFSLRGGFWVSGEALPKPELLFSDGFES